MGDPRIEPNRILPRTIRGRILLLLVAVLVPILLLQSFAYYSRFQERRIGEYRANLEVARSVAGAVEATVSDVIHNGLAIGLALRAARPVPQDQVTEYLRANARDFPNVSDFWWVSPQGRILAAARPRAGELDIGDRPYFQRIKKGLDWAVSDLYTESTTGEFSFFVARGIHDEWGALQGVTVGTVDAMRLGMSFPVERLGQGAFEILDSSGRLVYRYPEVDLSWEQRDLGDDLMVRSALAGREATGNYASAIDGVGRMGAVTPIRIFGWLVRAGRPEAEAMGEAVRDLGRDSALFLLAAFGAVLAALFISRTITIPVERVRQYAAALGRGGDSERAVIADPHEIQEVADTLSSMSAQVRAREEALREAQRRLMTEREQERKAVARDLHDRVIQDLLSINYQLESIASEASGYLDELTEIQDTVRLSVDNVRRVCRDLRPPAIDSLGLEAAIESHAQDWSKHTGIGVRLDLEPELGRLPETIELSVFRIVQEGLNNARKHSGASTVDLSLKRGSSRSLLLTIVDDGCGMPVAPDLAGLAASGHYGLLGISERVSLLGGRLRLESSPDGGFTLQAEIPHP